MVGWVRSITGIAIFMPSRYDGRRISLTAGLMAQCLKEITCPVQIIWGEKDALCHPNLQSRVDELRVAMPGIRVDTIPGAGHWVQYDASETSIGCCWNL
jgi:pimeloyl-ACP methyl ester carboxylesterase